MNTQIISDYKQVEDRPRLVQFSVVFTSINGRKEEFIFFAFSLSDCVDKCAAFINYMFQIQGKDYVYIFPVNSTTSFRNIYRRVKGMKGEYKIIQCQRDDQLTFYEVRTIFLGS